MDSEKRPRSKEDFDKWFKEKNGDPWNYTSRWVKNRLSESVAFLTKNIPASFSGNFIEFGAFNGDFTRLLCSEFPSAVVYAIDISEIATEASRQKNKEFKNIKYIVQDMFNFRKEDIDGYKNETIILLLECLYYLKENEREKALANIVSAFPAADVYISAPISGGNYFTEEGLLQMFGKLGYKQESFRVLNVRKFSLLKIILKRVCGISVFLRAKLANQVIYCFKPNDGK